MLQHQEILPLLRPALLLQAELPLLPGFPLPVRSAQLARGQARVLLPQPPAPAQQVQPQPWRVLPEQPQPWRVPLLPQWAPVRESALQKSQSLSWQSPSQRPQPLQPRPQQSLFRFHQKSRSHPRQHSRSRSFSYSRSASHKPRSGQPVPVPFQDYHRQFSATKVICS